MTIQFINKFKFVRCFLWTANLNANIFFLCIIKLKSKTMSHRFLPNDMEKLRRELMNVDQ